MIPMESFCDQHKIIHQENNEQTWYCAKDIAAVIDVRNVSSIVRHYPQNELCKLVTKTNGGPQSMLFLSIDAVKRFVARSRSSNPKAIKLTAALGMIVHAEKFLVPEQAMLCPIQKAFQGYSMISQYYVSPYLIDLYFPDHCVAVECDEESCHRGARLSDDIEREQYLRGKLDCTFIRFRPQLADFDVFELINTIMLAIHPKAS